MKPTVEELLAVLRKVHLFMGADDPTTYDQICAGCEAWLDHNEPHMPECPREAIVAVLKRWEENDAAD